MTNQHNSLLDAYRALAQKIVSQIKVPAVTDILLPEPSATAKLDQFGFVILADGSAAPFYCSLESSFEQIQQNLPHSGGAGLPLQVLLDGFNSHQLAQRALALGAFNAVSQSLFLQSGFDPCKLPTGRDQASPGLVGMVGFFRPLLARLLEQGNQILIVEKNRTRVELQPGVMLADDAAELQRCDRILCTASTLINDSLPQILAHRREGVPFTLIGPSGSGLPDVLFEQGVDEVGGFRVQDVDSLVQQVRAGESWGKSGGKYSISAPDYPGVDSLLERVTG